MRLTTASSLILLALAPALTHGFHVAGRPASTRLSTSIAARRSLLPTLRRSKSFFQDFDTVFEEMDEMMEQSLTTSFPRPSLSLLSKDFPEELNLKRPLGFEVTQDEKEWKVAVNVPDVEPKDIDLQLDHDGRVLRLKGDRSHEDGGMKVQSRFEKAILLAPDVDTTKLAANLSGDTLTVFAPKIERKAAHDQATDKKIDIKIEEPDKAPTQLAVENLKDEKVETKQTAKPEEMKWPARDFPY